MADIAVRARVTGRVQGVWFRAWTKQQAERLGLRGWVRNAADGSVEALVAGPETAVSEMVESLREGPEMARVADVAVTPAEADVPTGFLIAR